MSAAALSDLGRAAVKLAAAGRLVFPCHALTDAGACTCGNTDCSSPAKHPRTRAGLKEASSDVEHVAEWWRRWPTANVGMRTGGGLVVLDLDGPTAPAQLADLERELGPLSATLTVVTRRGRHLYFAVAPEARVPCSAGKLAAGIDVRADRGYVLVPPSRHADGSYRRHDGTAPAVLPVAWLARLTGADRPPRPARVATPTPNPGRGRERAYALAALDSEAQRVTHAPEGTRNATLNEGAFALGQLVAAGALDRGESGSALLVAALAAGLDEREAERTIRSGLDAGEREPREIPDAPAEITARDAAAPPAGDRRKSAGSAAPPDGLVVISAADVSPRAVEWLMPSRVPVGMLTLLAGDPDLGKSTFSCLLAAQVSRGELGPAGRVLIANAEDSPDATLVPRLIAAGADLQAVGFPLLRRYGTTEGLTLPDDVAKLSVCLDREPARLLVVDPLGAHLPSNVNSWQDASVRRALAPLAHLADKHRCAVVIVAHLNKSGTRDALYRVGGSIGIPGAVRSMLLFARDPDDPDGEHGSRRVAVHAKCNVARKAPTVVYRIESVTLPVGVETSRLTFEGESDLHPPTSSAARVSEPCRVRRLAIS